MRYITSFEKFAAAEAREKGLQEGRQEGRQEGLIEGLKKGLSLALGLTYGDEGVVFSKEIEGIEDAIAHLLVRFPLLHNLSESSYK